MNAQLKEKIRNRMLRTLKAHGYPDLTKEQILTLLPSLWISVIDLVPPESGFTYDHFEAVAQQQYIKSKEG